MSFKRSLVLVAVSAAVMFAQSGTTVASFRSEPGLSPEVLTNEGVAALAYAGYSAAFIVQKILISNRTSFDTSAEGLAYLRRNAIPQDLVQFVVELLSNPCFQSSVN